MTSPSTQKRMLAGLSLFFFIPVFCFFAVIADHYPGSDKWFVPILHAIHRPLYVVYVLYAALDLEFQGHNQYYGVANLVATSGDWLIAAMTCSLKYTGSISETWPSGLFALFIGVLLILSNILTWYLIIALSIIVYGPVRWKATCKDRSFDILHVLKMDDLDEEGTPVSLETV